MTALGEKLRTSPVHARFIPYAIITALTFCQDSGSGPIRFWMYFIKMVVAAWCIWEVRSVVTEARWAFSWEAVAAGVLVFVIWVGLDPYYPKNEIIFKASPPWNPFKEFGDGSIAGWWFVVVRTVGSAVLVPPIEEAFYRSFLYRFLVRTNFTEMPMTRFHPLSFVVTSSLFAFVHYQWLGGLLCGFIFQGMVIRKGRLGDAMTAHGITNFMLGVWIVWKGAWQFW